MQTLSLGSIATFHYTDNRGYISARRVVVLGLQYGQNEFYREPQWLLQTFDLERLEFRSFSLAKIDTSTLATRRD